MVGTVVQLLGLFLVGLLAAEELVVRYGAHPALSRLNDAAAVEVRQALVRRLRVLVPVIMVPAVLVGIATVVIGGAGLGLPFGIAGVAALAGFLLIAFVGTVQINIRVLTWEAGAPPTDWEDTVRRWERLDLFRSSVVILASRSSQSPALHNWSCERSVRDPDRIRPRHRLPVRGLTRANVGTLLRAVAVS